MSLLEPRVHDLEQIVAQLAHAQLRTEMSLDRLSREMREFKDEMRSFKDEMRSFKDEMRSFKDEMGQFKNEMLEFKDEMGEFKNEMLEFKEENRRERNRMNKAWGDLANKLGTIAEDIVAPNIRRMAGAEFGVEAWQDFLVRPQRRSRRGAPRIGEYDVVCAGASRIIVAETKSTPSPAHVPEFLAHLAEFCDFFPEYEGREIVGVFASWSLDARMCEALSLAGLYGIAMGEETMDVVARPAKAP